MSGTARDPWARFEVVTPAQATDPWARFEVVKQEPNKPGWLQSVDNVVRQVAKGATFGFADEIAAAGNAAVGSVTGQPGTFSERYDAGLAAERGRDKQFEGDNPGTSVALQAGGSLLNPATRFVARGSLPLQMAGNAAVGGAIGGVAGFGEGEGGFINRMGPALTGGATGAALGATLPPIATALAKGARTAGGWMGLNNAATDGQRQIYKAVQADVAAGGDDLPTLAARLRAAPADQPMILPDMAGEATMGLAQAVSREPGVGRATAKAAVDARGGLNQSARLADAVKRGISAEDFLGAEKDLIETRARTAGPAYEAAMAWKAPVDVKPILDDISARLGTAKGDIQATLQKAQRLFRNRGGQMDTSITGLHETKLALDAMLEKTPTNSISRVARRELVQIQERLLAAMDDATQGEYKMARDAFAGPSRAMDAMELGKRILKGDADETAAEIAKLSPSERDFLRIGVSRALIQRVKSGGDTEDIRKLKSIWGSEATRERVAAAFDDPKAFDEFSDYMKREMDMARTNQVINPRAGSQTAPILAQRGQPAPMGPMLSTMVSALRGDALGTGANVLRTAGAMAPGATLRAEEIAPYLFTMKPGDRARLIDQLIARETTDQGREALAKALSGALLKGGTVAGVQLEN